MINITEELVWACEKTDPPPIDLPVEALKTLEIEWTTLMDFEKEILNIDVTQHHEANYVIV